MKINCDERKKKKENKVRNTLNHQPSIYCGKICTYTDLWFLFFFTQNMTNNKQNKTKNSQFNRKNGDGMCHWTLMKYNLDEVNFFFCSLCLPKMRSHWKKWQEKWIKKKKKKTVDVALCLKNLWLSDARIFFPSRDNSLQLA